MEWRHIGRPVVGIEGVQREYLPGWDLRVEVVSDGARAGLRRVAVESSDGLPRPLPATVLRTLNMGELNDRIEELLTTSPLRFLLPPSLRREVVRSRPGRRGRGDEFYAERVAEFVAAMKHEPRTPIRWLVEEGESPTNSRPSEKTWRTWLAEAERRGLITDRPDQSEGRTGGRMTAKCRRLLAGSLDNKEG
ncbi:MAG: hypothetical protein HY826_02420 [Actinobacteria bacterium]|nr:hypothetical protein [Actinomycetota bacterium]